MKSKGYIRAKTISQFEQNSKWSSAVCENRVERVIADAQAIHEAGGDPREHVEKFWREAIAYLSQLPEPSGSSTYNLLDYIWEEKINDTSKALKDAVNGSKEERQRDIGNCTGQAIRAHREHMRSAAND